MSDSQSEYENYCAKHEFKDIVYRKTPLKIFPASKFDYSKIFSKEESQEKNTSIFLHEPLTTLQKYIGEIAEDYVVMEVFEENTLMELLIHFTSFVISNLSIAIKGRIFPPVPSYLGETYEIEDSYIKMLIIGETVSESPSIHVGHYESKHYEMKLYISKKYEYEGDILRVVVHDKLTLKSKKDGSEFIANRPDMIVHLEDPSDPWIELKGTQTIQHTKSKARAEITLKGVHKYSKEDCIDGKIFDSEGKLHATLTGSYLTSLYIKYEEADEKVELAQFEDFKTIFENYFSFSSHTLVLNDPIYDVKCPTDSRLRGDIMLLENGDIEGALKIQESIKEKVKKQEEERQKKGIEYTPKWFKKINAEGSQEIDYEYTGKYWETKLSGKF